MAKRHGSKRGSHYSYQSNATPRGVLRPSLSSVVLSLPSPARAIIPDLEWFDSSMDEVSDRRRFDADPVKPAKKASGMPARLRALYHSPMSQIGFEDPKRVLICVRRVVRREVLFAKRKTRKGARGAKRRNYYSDVRC